MEPKKNKKIFNESFISSGHASIMLNTIYPVNYQYREIWVQRFYIHANGKWSNAEEVLFGGKIEQPTNYRKNRHGIDFTMKLPAGFVNVVMDDYSRIMSINGPSLVSIKECLPIMTRVLECVCTLEPVSEGNLQSIRSIPASKENQSEMNY